MYTEDDLQPISALQHLAFCERQWALIYLEGLWAENRLTVEGRHLHEHVHDAGNEAREDVRVTRGLHVRSLRLGLSGIADVVEFRRCPRDDGTTLAGLPGRWMPFPVEYKRGRPKRDRCDEVQLCAQALCIEEMLDCCVPEGAMFYGATRRRLAVPFSAGLRAHTEALAARVHELVREGRSPPPVYTKACDNCSLVEQCLPKALGAERRSARIYLSRAIAAMVRERQEGPDA